MSFMSILSFLSSPLLRTIETMNNPSTLPCLWKKRCVVAQMFWFFLVGCLVMHSVAFSHSEDVLFIGSYTSFISRYSLQANGTLGYLGQSAVDQNPSWIVLSSNRQILFAVNEIENYGGEYSGAVSSYAVQPDQSLLFLSRVSSGGADPCHATLSPTNSILYVSNYCSGTLSVIRVNSDGTLNEPSQIIQFNENQNTTSCSEQNGSHIHEVTFSGNDSILVNDLGKNVIYRFQIESDGLLNPNPTQTTPIATAGAGPRHTVIHPDAPFSFVINELSNTISSFSYDHQTGSLVKEISSITTLRSTEENVDMGAAEIQISQDGRFLYGSNRDLSSPNQNRSSIVVMAIDLTSGSLTPIQHIDTLGIHPRHFNLFFNGSVLIVGNLKSNSLVSFSVDPSTGLLSEAAVCQISADSPTHILSSR